MNCLNSAIRHTVIQLTRSSKVPYQGGGGFAPQGYAMSLDVE